MRKQQGMSFLSFVVVLAAILSVLLAAIKIAPVYIEYMAIKKVIKKLSNEPNLNEMSKADIELEFNKNAEIDNVATVSYKDLEYSKDESGKTVLTIEYQVVKPLVGNLSALMDFKATTAR